MSRILITGTSRGLGRALAVALTQRGHTVLACARHIDQLADLAVAEKITLDVTDPEAVAAAAKTAGTVDVLINNAAITVGGPVEAVPAEAVLNSTL